MPKPTDQNDTWARRRVGGTTAGRLVAGAGASGISGSAAVLILWWLHDLQKLEVGPEQASAITVILIMVGNGVLRIFGDWVQPILAAFRDRWINNIQTKGRQ